MICYLQIVIYLSGGLYRRSHWSAWPNQRGVEIEAIRHLDPVLLFKTRRGQETRSRTRRAHTTLRIWLWIFKVSHCTSLPRRQEKLWHIAICNVEVSMMINYWVPSQRFHTLKIPFTGKQWDKRITGRNTRMMKEEAAVLLQTFVGGQLPEL